MDNVVQTDAPLWQSINALFARHGLPEPPWQLRDELIRWLGEREIAGLRQLAQKQ